MSARCRGSIYQQQRFLYSNCLSQTSDLCCIWNRTNKLPLLSSDSERKHGFGYIRLADIMQVNKLDTRSFKPRHLLLSLNNKPPNSHVCPQKTRATVASIPSEFSDIARACSRRRRVSRTGRNQNSNPRLCDGGVSLAGSVPNRSFDDDILFVGCFRSFFCWVGVSTMEKRGERRNLLASHVRSQRDGES